MVCNRWMQWVAVSGAFALTASCVAGPVKGTRAEEGAAAITTPVNSGPPAPAAAPAETATKAPETAPPVAEAQPRPPSPAPAETATRAGAPEVKTTKVEEPKSESPKAQAPKVVGKAYVLVAVPAPDKKTERQWKAKCASCHGTDGKGDTDKGKEMKIVDMTAAAWQTSRANAALAKAINNGVKKESGGVKQQMDGFQSELSAEQVDALVSYVRWLGAPK